MVRQRIHPEDRERAIAVGARGLSAETDYRSEFRIVLPDGRVRHILSLGHSVLRVNESHIQMVGTHVDMTERKHAEEALRQAQAALAHVTRLTTMGEMTASIAHEINQPLSGIVSNGSACLRWLAGDVPNLEEARDAARRIVRDGKRAGAVIAQIRALAKKTDIAMARLDMNETIREILSLARDEVARNLVTTHLHLAADLSPVLGDRVQLQQVVLNLIMNGIEAMHSVEGRPRDLVILTRNVEANQVQVAIQDSGTGLGP